MDKRIKITYKAIRLFKTLTIRVQDILGLNRRMEYLELRYFCNEEQKTKTLLLFKDSLMGWTDSKGNDLQGFDRLADTLSVYAEKKSIEIALDSLD